MRTEATKSGGFLRRRIVVILAATAAAAGLAACDDGGGSEPADGGDVEVPVGDDAGGETAGEGEAAADVDLEEGEAEAEAAGPVCRVNNGVTADLELAGSGTSLIEYRAYMGTEPPYEVLRVQIMGDNVGRVHTGVYELAGTTYQDCEVCVSVLTGCRSGPCERFFYPVAGSIEIDAIGDEGERFAGRLLGIEMAEFEILDGGIAEDPLPGGDDWCIPDYDFDRTATGSHEAVCGRPTVPCLGETALDFSLESCSTGEMVSMSSLAAGNRALVYAMVTGWCPYCPAWVDTLVGYQATYGDAGLAVAYVYGEDGSRGAPDAAECLEYARRHGADPADFYLDHDGTSSFATTTFAMWPWVVESDTMSLPWSTILDAQTHEYVYTSQDEPPPDFETVLLGLLEG